MKESISTRRPNKAEFKRYYGELELTRIIGAIIMHNARLVARNVIPVKSIARTMVDI